MEQKLNLHCLVFGFVVSLKLASQECQVGNYGVKMLTPKA